MKYSNLNFKPKAIFGLILGSLLNTHNDIIYIYIYRQFQNFVQISIYQYVYFTVYNS